MQSFFSILKKTFFIYYEWVSLCDVIIVVCATDALLLMGMGFYQFFLLLLVEFGEKNFVQKHQVFQATLLGSNGNILSCMPD